MVLPHHPQAEIDSGFADEFLATSVGVSWVYRGQGAFGRADMEDLAKSDGRREDL